MSALLQRFRQDVRGSTSAELVLILPVFVMMVFGMIDVAGYAWRMNMAQKATQFGARYAVVTDPVAPGLATEDYVGKTYNSVTLTQGDVIPAVALGTITCDKSSCTSSGNAPATLGYSSTAFNNILTRMRGIEPSITAANLKIEYRGSGVGYAGDPGEMQISPLTTVRLTGMTYSPWMGLFFKGGIALPQVSYTLTMEDAVGTTSN